MMTHTTTTTTQAERLADIDRREAQLREWLAKPGMVAKYRKAAQMALALIPAERADVLAGR